MQTRENPSTTHFATQLEVHHHNRNLRARYYKDNEYYKKETEHIVEMLLPYCCQNEEKFDEHSAKRQHAGNERPVGKEKKHTIFRDQ